MGDWDGQEILDRYICDYMIKKGMIRTAEIFAKESGFCIEPIAIDSPEGFLMEWWSVFWECYSSKAPEKAWDIAPQGMANVSQVISPMMPHLNANSVPTRGNVMDNVYPVVSKPAMVPPWFAQFPSDPNSGMMLEQPQFPIGYNVGMTQSQERFPGVPNGAIMQGPAQFHCGSNVRTMQEQEQLPSSSNARMVQEQLLLNLLAAQYQLCEDSAREFNSTSQALDFDALAHTLLMEPSGNSNYQLQRLPQRPQQHATMDGRHGINSGHSLPINENLNAKARASKTKPPNAGKAKRLKQLAPKGWPLGSNRVHPTIHHQVLKPGARPSLAPAAHILQDTASSLAPQTSENLGQMIGDIHNATRATQVKQTIEQQVEGPSKKAEVSGNLTARQEQIMQTKIPSSRQVGKDGLERAANENPESHSSHDEYSPPNTSTSFSSQTKTPVPCNRAERKDYSFEEHYSLQPTISKLLCCQFSSQGKLLACAGERKVVIWDAESYTVNTTEGHSHLITDIRFRPNATVFATSSFDRTVLLWDAAKPNKSLYQLSGHTDHVMSLDFHPKKVDLLCSCDSSNEIRMWNVNEGSCTHVTKGGNRQVRFQPQFGKIMAAATGNAINLFDVETSIIHRHLHGHVADVHSLCWDTSGRYLASVSADSARIWSVFSGGQCIYELQSRGNNFESCTFHPTHPQVLVIGSHQFLEVWSPGESDKTVSYKAHHDVISALAGSTETGMLASVSHDQWIRLWK